MDPVSINSTKTHGPSQHQQHKNTWTPLASPAQKHMDPVNINSTKTHGPSQHQQHKNTWTQSASTAQKHTSLNINYTRDDTKLKPTDKTKISLLSQIGSFFWTNSTLIFMLALPTFCSQPVLATTVSRFQVTRLNKHISIASFHGKQMNRLHYPVPVC